MSGRRTSFGKLERERAKKAKAVAKMEHRQSRGQGNDDPDDLATDGSELESPRRESELSTEQLLALVDELHQRFDAGVVGYEDFEKQKAELLGQLRVD